MIEFIGVTFPPSSQWHEDERALIEKITNQIDENFPQHNNLFINTTWFGPQFDNGQYQKFENICSTKKFDNLFLLAAADPVFLADHQIEEMHVRSGNGNLYLLGHFDTKYNFNFHSTVLPKYFKSYSDNELKMRSVSYKFINYNRKPRPHRTNLVDALISNNLHQHGIVTHGADKTMTLGETVEEIGKENQWWPENELSIPHDIHSLGRMEVWQNHFLTVVSETESNNAVPTFVSEKIWKPIIGMRPFIINGQSKSYKWLRDRGFKTFNQFWQHLHVETADDTPHTCAKVIEYICDKSTQELEEIYKHILPDLAHNRNRFYEFSIEQKNKTETLFC